MIFEVGNGLPYSWISRDNIEKNSCPTKCNPHIQGSPNPNANAIL